MTYKSYEEACQGVPSPCYLVNEADLRRNLQLIDRVRREAGVEIILAFKAFALWKLFPIFREYGFKCTASSLSEARLAKEEMQCLAHTYAPIYTEREFPTIADCSSHITFNSVSHFLRHRDEALRRGISCGLRINPEFSDVETELYNPCAPGSRLGVTAERLQGQLPDGIEGLHCHTLCESTSYDLERTLKVIEERFATQLQQVKWLNLGGGHLMTRKDYEPEHLIALLRDFKNRYPHLQVILEPGSAFAWHTGMLVSSIEDIVENNGVRTAMLNVSFACHMPDCLEMPYKPAIVGARDPEEGERGYRMGGNSCLSGDYYGEWCFPEPLKVGQRIVFEDMIHYTTVKTTMFNGVSHPSLAIYHLNGEVEMLREYGYDDYRSRMD